MLKLYKKDFDILLYFGYYTLNINQDENMITFQKPKRLEYPKIVDLVNKADSIYFDIYSKQIAAEMYISSESVDGLIGREKTRDYICIYENNILVGFASFRINNIQTLWLSEFYVDFEYQKSGFGTLLLNEIEKIAKNKNVLVVVLETDKNALWAVKFYIKNKYIILDKIVLKKFPFNLVLEKDPVEYHYMFGKVVG